MYSQEQPNHVGLFGQVLVYADERTVTGGSCLYTQIVCATNINVAHISVF